MSNEKVLHLFPNFVKHLVENTVQDVELIITDWKSTDWKLYDWIPSIVRELPFKIIDIERGGFSRGYGLNQAAEHASGDNLFFTDTDMLIGQETLRKASRLLSEGRIYSPVIRSYNTLKQDKSDATWRDAGYGNLFISREHFEQTKGWPEYWKWGGEDDHFIKLLKSRYNVLRQRDQDLWHQWHPNEMDFRNRYGT